MTGVLTEEQQALRDLAQSLLRRQDPVGALRLRLDAGGAQVDASALASVAESGLLGLLREDEGGSCLDLAVVVEELGAGLSPIPLAELAVTARLLDAVDPDAAGSLAEGAFLALPVLAQDGWEVGPERVRGTGADLPGTREAQGFLVLTDGGARLVRRDEGTTVTPRALLDLSRSWGTVEVDVDGPGTSSDALAWARDALALFRTVDALGTAARLLAMTVAYAGEREQFGRAIGSFQAVKHHCADMAVRVAASRAVLHDAAAALDEAPDAERSRLVSAAAAYAGPACSQVAGTALQVHGGMGFTWEHDLHLLMRRARTDEVLDGTPSAHRRRLVATA